MSKLLLFAVMITSSIYQTPTGTTGVNFNAPSAAYSTISVEPPSPPFLETRKSTWITAYSSTPDQTDTTPFITASGTRVRDGIVATNYLPIGTKVKIPSLFGDKVFTVEDRMHERKKNVIDIWMKSKEDALRFGSHYTEILIIEEPAPLLALEKK